MDPTALGAEALATGHTDLGVKGLELLTGGASDEEGQAVLERAMLTRKDDLAIEAAKLLIARRGVAAVAGRALEAAHEPLRRQAVSWLAAEYGEGPGRPRRAPSGPRVALPGRPRGGRAGAGHARRTRPPSKRWSASSRRRATRTASAG